MGLLFSCMNPFWHLTHLSFLHLPSPAKPCSSTSKHSSLEPGEGVCGVQLVARANVLHTSPLQGSSLEQADLVNSHPSPNLPLLTCVFQIHN